MCVCVCLYVCKSLLSGSCLNTIIQMNLFTKQKQTHKLREQIYGYQGEGCGGGRVREFGIDIYTLLYLKWITNKDLLYSIRNAAQYSVIT